MAFPYDVSFIRIDQAEMRIAVRFRVVKLWEIDASVALDPSHPRLLPLVPLMRSTAGRSKKQ